MGAVCPQDVGRHEQLWPNLRVIVLTRAPNTYKCFKKKTSGFNYKITLLHLDAGFERESQG
jgi:hypothetical protein